MIHCKLITDFIVYIYESKLKLKYIQTIKEAEIGTQHRLVKLELRLHRIRENEKKHKKIRICRLQENRNQKDSKKRQHKYLKNVKNNIEIGIKLDLLGQRITNQNY